MSWANCDRGGENCDGKLIRVTIPVLWRARLENLWSPAKGLIEQLIRGELDTVWNSGREVPRTPAHDRILRRRISQHLTQRPSRLA